MMFKLLPTHHSKKHAQHMVERRLGLWFSVGLPVDRRCSTIEPVVAEHHGNSSSDSTPLTVLRPWTALFDVLLPIKLVETREVSCAACPEIGIGYVSPYQTYEHETTLALFSQAWPVLCVMSSNRALRQARKCLYNNGPCDWAMGVKPRSFNVFLRRSLPGDSVAQGSAPAF